MRLAMVCLMVALVACVAGEPARRSRWPTHRTEKDQKIEELLWRVDKLEKQLADLQTAIATQRALAPPPGPATLPQIGGATP